MEEEIRVQKVFWNIKILYSSEKFEYIGLLGTCKNWMSVSSCLFYTENNNHPWNLCCNTEHFHTLTTIQLATKDTATKHCQSKIQDIKSKSAVLSPWIHKLMREIDLSLNTKHIASALIKVQIQCYIRY